MSEKPEKRPASELLIAYRWPLTLLLIVLFGLLFLRGSMQRVGQVAESVGSLAGSAVDGARQIAGSFATGTITETFVSALPEIDASGAGRLELAAFEVTETLTRSDERRLLWDAVSLGTTVTEIKVPVTYRYHMRLTDPWRLEVRGQTCIVYPPPFRATLPPAIHTDRMEKRVEADWLRFNAEEQLAALERSLTPTLSEYAEDPRHRELVRETARRTLAEFVRTWLLREEQWSEDRFRNIKVIFPDEETVDPERRPASLTLEGWPAATAPEG